MAVRLAAGPSHRVGALWGAGLLFEAAPLLVLFTVLVRPVQPVQAVTILRGSSDHRDARP